MLGGTYVGKVVDAVAQLVTPIAVALGLEVVEVKYAKEYNGMNLTVFIDKEGGVSINDCETLHRAIDAPLDELDPIEGAYILNVSSLGIDRPLTTPRDFERNLNKKISVKLYQAVDKKKLFVGILIEFDDTTFTISDDKGVQTTFDKQKTAHIEPVIDF
jgi:ribosome maturation factor RimP